MNALKALFAAIPMLVESILPLIRSIQNVSEATELYSESIKDDAKIARATSQREYLDALTKLNLTEED